MDFSTLCVIGMGYIGLPYATIFASKGLQVTGMDVNTKIIETLNAGCPHIFEPGLNELFKTVLKSGKLTISCDVEPADAFIIAVPTPFDAHKHADLSAVISACEAIAPHLRRGNLVILESTSPPRTTLDLVAPLLEQSGLTAGEDFLLAYSPERVLPGKILQELVENPRVIGGINGASAQAGHDLYRIFVEGEIILTDATTAEMVKLMENTSRDINIAIANEFSRLAEEFNVDIWEAIEIANLHPRVDILKPGVGVGGHCISVDPWFLAQGAPETAQLIKAARDVNDAQPAFIADQIAMHAGNLKEKKIAFLGLAFKPNIDDLRGSPALELAHRLAEVGAQVVVYEPFKKDLDQPGLQQAENLAETLAGADLIVLAVGHRCFKNLDPLEVRTQTGARLVYDAVRAWDKGHWEAAGFEFCGLARKK